MSEPEKMVLRIRMMLAMIKSKEEELDSQRAEFANQLPRIQRYALYGNIALDSSLLLVEEVENRLNHVEGTLRRLSHTVLRGDGAFRTSIYDQVPRPNRPNLKFSYSHC